MAHLENFLPALSHVAVPFPHLSKNVSFLATQRSTHTEGCSSTQAVLIPTESCGAADICSFCMLMVEVVADLLIQVEITIAGSTVAVKCADF